MHQKSSARKVTHLSTDSGEGLGFKPLLADTYFVSQYWIICAISSITGVDHRMIVVESLAFGLRTMHLVDCKEEVLK